MPWRMKRTIITQEILRVLLRCSPELKWEKVTDHVNYMMKKIQYSGYNKRFRAEVVTSALNAYRIIQQKDKDGIQPMYRHKEWNKKEREENKKGKKLDWFKKKGEETVIFIPATPRSELKKQLEEEVKKSKVKVKIVERAGKTLKNILQRSDPFKKKQCDKKETCMVCSSGRKGPCRRDGVTYEIRCEECKGIYVGETSRNGYTRGEEHMTAFRNRSDDSVLWRHVRECHTTPPIPSFQMTITGIYGDDCTLRQVAEVVKINKIPAAKLMNSRQEWNHPILPRTSVTAI